MRPLCARAAPWSAPPAALPLPPAALCGPAPCGDARRGADLRLPCAQHARSSSCRRTSAHELLRARAEHTRSRGARARGQHAQHTRSTREAHDSASRCPHPAARHPAAFCPYTLVPYPSAQPLCLYPLAHNNMPIHSHTPAQAREATTTPYCTTMALGTLMILLTAQLRRDDGSRSIAARWKNERLFGQKITGVTRDARARSGMPIKLDADYDQWKDTFLRRGVLCLALCLLLLVWYKCGACAARR